MMGGPPHQNHEERLLPNRKLNKNGNNKSRYNSENNGFWVPADFFLNSFISGIPVISAPLYAAILCITTTAALNIPTLNCSFLKLDTKYVLPTEPQKLSGSISS